MSNAGIASFFQTLFNAMATRQADEATGATATKNVVAPPRRARHTGQFGLGGRNLPGNTLGISQSGRQTAMDALYGPKAGTAAPVNQPELDLIRRYQENDPMAVERINNANPQDPVAQVARGIIANKARGQVQSQQLDTPFSASNGTRGATIAQAMKENERAAATGRTGADARAEYEAARRGDPLGYRESSWWTDPNWRDKRPLRVDNQGNPVTALGKLPRSIRPGQEVFDDVDHVGSGGLKNWVVTNEAKPTKSTSAAGASDKPLTDDSLFPDYSTGSVEQKKEAAAAAKKDDGKTFWDKIAEAGQNKGGTNYWDALSAMGAAMAANKGVGKNAFLQDLSAGASALGGQSKSQRQERAAAADKAEKQMIERRKVGAAEKQADAAMIKAKMPTDKQMAVRSFYNQAKMDLMEANPTWSPIKVAREAQRVALNRVYTSPEHQAFLKAWFDSNPMRVADDELLRRLQALPGGVKQKRKTAASAGIKVN